MAQIEFEDVHKSYGVAARALDGVNLSFEDGVTTAVIGRSGGGKSTLLQSINGVVRPDRGVVRVFGEPIDYRALPALRRRIGYAVQGSGLFPHMTVSDNVNLLGRLAGWPRERLLERTGEVMALVELPPRFEGRYPNELSGGEQQRVGLCRALFLDPPVVLLDEPFGALDPITRGEIHREFLRLRESALGTTILVTHDVREAVKLAQRMVVLDGGRVLQAGASEDVIAQPRGETVARLIRDQMAS